MTISVFCPWCVNKCAGTVGVPVHCSKCNHRADVPKDQCDCQLCQVVAHQRAQLPEITVEQLGALPDVGVFEAPPDEEPFAVDEYPPNTPEGIQVAGRGWNQPRVRVAVCGDTFVIYLDDGGDPEKWLQVRIHESVVASWDRFSGTRTDIE